MADILEKAKQHYKDRMDGEMLSFTADKWGITVYWKPLNLKQQNKIYKYIRDGSLESLAETLIIRARNVDGSMMFKPVNKTELMTMVDPGVINDICEAMGEDVEADAEAAPGN